MTDTYTMTTTVRAWRVTEDGEVPDWISIEGDYRTDPDFRYVNVNITWRRTIDAYVGDWVFEDTSDGIEGVELMIVDDDWFRAHCAPVEGE